MKPRRIDLAGAKEPGEIVRRIVAARLAEARALAGELQHRRSRGLHAFRIACKRLRYALERFENLDPSLQRAAERLAGVQDALGDTHDRDVLLSILPPSMGATQRRLTIERESSVARAKRLWRGVPAMLKP